VLELELAEPARRDGTVALKEGNPKIADSVVRYPWSGFLVGATGPSCGAAVELQQALSKRAYPRLSPGELDKKPQQQPRKFSLEKCKIGEQQETCKQPEAVLATQ